MRRLMAGMVVAALLAVSCSDGGGEGGRKVDEPALLLTPAAAETPVAASAFFGIEQKTPAAGVQPEAVALALLMSRGLDSTYRAIYETRSPEGQAGDTYVVYRRPPLTRIDSIPQGALAPASLIIARGAGLTVSCSPGTAGNWQCFEIDPTGSDLLVGAGPIVFPSAEDLKSSQVTETAARTIAGHRARCFELKQAGALSVDYCVSDDGVVLSSAGSSGSTEATEVSSSVTDKDFTLPE